MHNLSQVKLHEASTTLQFLQSFRCCCFVLFCWYSSKLEFDFFLVTSHHKALNW